MRSRARSTITVQRDADRACSTGSAGSDKSFFRRTEPTLSTGDEVQFVRVLHSKFAAAISDGVEESSSESEMTTLYDLLGALPHDDAQGLTPAFPRAVTCAPPAIRPVVPHSAPRCLQYGHA